MDNRKCPLKEINLLVDIKTGLERLYEKERHPEAKKHKRGSP